MMITIRSNPRSGLRCFKILSILSFTLIVSILISFPSAAYPVKPIPLSFVVHHRVHNKVDVITPISFRVATNGRPHIPWARIPHTDVIHWAKPLGPKAWPWIYRRIIDGPGKDPYTGYFIY